MTFDQYKKAFKIAASNSGYSEDNINRCLIYAETLLNNKVPVIYNTSHLSALVGYKKDYVKKAAYYTNSFYTNYKIKKKTGGVRVISEPLPSLKEIQTWILENILEEVKISAYAKAYKKGVNLIDNLKFHHNQPKVFSVDIKDFFPSIKLSSVEGIFRNLGYSELIANLLAKLCTKEFCLPQGAPTSPYLSNIYFLAADNSISQYCKDNAIRYTRYADDLTFSGEFNENTLLQFITETISQYGFSINERKTRLMKKHQQQRVTGVVVNEKAQVSFNKRNKIRQELYYIKKFGLENHIENQKIKTKNYLEHLLGKINFVLFINPSDPEFIAYKDYLVTLKKDAD